ncbi:phosphotransferase family protein [Neglectibacter caecimuris]|uniref:phosphotransferase family protein n=1 Tax=Neglectibacter caecimuris TaxID=3093658 RepID=UPI002AC9340F|nr:aminoglycoside phosphotransferase family protein [Neglectibacter sp. M00184]
MKLEKIIAVRNSKTIYRDGKYAIKVFDEEYSKADILNEALNIARVEETGMPIPGVEEVAKIDGKWAIVTEFVEGKTIAQLMEENPEKKEEYLERFVDIQLEMHQKTAPRLNKLKDKMKRKISETKLDATTRYELDARLGSMPKHNKLCHGDFNPTNVVIRADGSYAILDWAHATQGNASADAARTYLLFCLNGDTETADRYMDLFCKKSDTAKQYVQKWLPIVAASQSVKGKPEEQEFLMRWVNVVEYE